MRRTKTISLVKDGIFMILGVAAAAFGLESFLLPNHFIDGGVTGISLLLVELTGLRLSVLLFLVNLPFLVLARIVIGRHFAIKTAVAITLLVLTIFFVHFPEVTEDKLLVSVFGGFFLGTGIGLSMRGCSVLGGTEVLAIGDDSGEEEDQDEGEARMMQYQHILMNDTKMCRQLLGAKRRGSSTKNPLPQNEKEAEHLHYLVGNACGALQVAKIRRADIDKADLQRKTLNPRKTSCQLLNNSASKTYPSTPTSRFSGRTETDWPGVSLSQHGS